MMRKKEFFRETFTYLLCGILTVGINIFIYRLLAVYFEKILSNTIAFFIAVIFAYWSNSTFVFHKPLSRASFFRFLGMRIGTLLIDDVGMWLMLSWNVPDLLAKCIVNFIMIAINYLVNKLIIFRKSDDG